MNKTLIRHAARILAREARARFDSCSGADGSGFVCGSCDEHRRCKREHDTMVAAAKGLRDMARAKK